MKQGLKFFDVLRVKLWNFRARFYLELDLAIKTPIAVAFPPPNT